MSPRTKNKISALKRILYTLDGEPVPVPGSDIPEFMLFKEGYKIAREDLEILEEYRDISISEIYKFHDGKTVAIRGALQYSVCKIGIVETPVYYVNFYTVPEVKVFLNRLIELMEWEFLK
jgi:hypothetical protein